MRHALAILVLPGAMMLAQVPGASSTSPSNRESSLQQKARLEGAVVTSTTGEPLRKAEITLRATNSNRGLTVDSDAEGKFSFEDIEPGLYYLSITRAGYVPQHGYRSKNASPAIQLDPGQQKKDVVIRLTPGATIAGRVLDQDGDLRPGSAEVRLQRHVRTTSGRKVSDVDSADTNAEGGFVFTGLAAGRYYLVAYPRGPGGSYQIRRSPEDTDMVTYYPDAPAAESAVPIEVPAGGEFRGADLRIRKGRAVHVRGRVSNSAPGLTVVLHSAAGIHNAPPVLVRSGAFDIPNVPPGPYDLIAGNFLPGQARSANDARLHGQATITVDQMDLNDIELAVRPALTITGKFRVDGQAEAQPQWPSRPSFRFRSEITPFAAGEVFADGSLRAVNVPPVEQRIEVTPPPGMYVKSIRAGGQDYTHTAIASAALEAGPLEILLSPNAGEIAGAVRDEKGDPIPGFQVALWTKLDSSPQVGTTQEGGGFRFSSLAPGDYFVAAWESGQALESTDIPTLFDSRATKVTVQESTRATAEVMPIGADEIDELLSKLP